MGNTYKNVRTRFAPSPTGPLHIGGVRTALFAYLFAKRYGGEFLLRIEDTDQERYVPGAEEYIMEALNWLSISPDEGPMIGGKYGPYRQSERLDIYKEFVDKLIEKGKAYYAFDTREELEAAREANPIFKYGVGTRENLRNSLTLSDDEIARLKNYPHVVRLKVPENEEIHLEDMVRGKIVVNSNDIDDKVIWKGDGFPTYHLASVVDDYLMKITHVIRGEEWLPSAPFHVLLYKALGLKSVMPSFAHLPLILKPVIPGRPASESKGKLSKRDGDELGFPVFPIRWVNPDTGEESLGYREKGFLPSAVNNMLAMLGWHPGGNEEIFTFNKLVEKFDLKRVNKSGARFSIDKSRFFNQKHINLLKPVDIEQLIHDAILQKGQAGVLNDKQIKMIASQIKNKISYTTEVWEFISYFFRNPITFRQDIVESKFSDNTEEFINSFCLRLNKLGKDFNLQSIEAAYNETSVEFGVAPAFYKPLLRILLAGDKGIDLFLIINYLGLDAVIFRLKSNLKMCLEMYNIQLA